MFPMLECKNLAYKITLCKESSDPLLKPECQSHLLATGSVILVLKSKNLSEARFVARGNVFH